MNGTRIATKGSGTLPGLDSWPNGGYGYWIPADGEPRWVLKTPNGHACSVSPTIHKLVEHEDGTITVSPSIRVFGTDKDGETIETWHGYLRAGVWTGVGPWV